MWTQQRSRSQRRRRRRGNNNNNNARPERRYRRKQPQVPQPTPAETRERLESAWKRYESIDRHNNDEMMDKIIKGGHTDPSVEWVITEKIHGANFGFITDGTNVVPTKRKSLLSDETPFFRGWQGVARSHESKAIQIFAHIKTNVMPEVETITIFGELFGGYYEHPDIMVPESIQQIQWGLSYTPNLHFCAFDIRIGSSDFLDYDLARAICCEFDIMFAEPLGRGPFDECMEFDVESFASTVPARLGLPPPMTRHGELNIAEGVVIRRASGEHLMVKKKADKFWEFSNKNGTAVAEERREIIALVGEPCFQFVRNCMTEARFDAAVSKIGEVSKENVAEIQAEFAEDILRDTVEEYEFLERISSVEWKTVQDYVVKWANKFGKKCVTARRKRMRGAANQTRS